MKSIFLLAAISTIMLLFPLHLQANTSAATMDNENNPEQGQDHLLVVWTSADPEVAHLMVFMYTLAAKKNGWWKEVSLLIWGPSARLASSDAEIRQSLREMQEAGVELLACKACADRCSVSPELVSQGIDVRYTGTYLTDFLKSGKKVVTF